jgi:hypothetical protein
MHKKVQGRAAYGSWETSRETCWEKVNGLRMPDRRNTNHESGQGSSATSSRAARQQGDEQSHGDANYPAMEYNTTQCDNGRAALKQATHKREAAAQQ